MTTTRTQIAIVGCGKAKRNGWHKARNLYTSSYFEKKRRFAEVGCDDWLILSAKYGLIDPDSPIPTYDVTMSDVDHDDFASRVADQVDDYADAFSQADRVVMLAGSDYIDAVDDVFDSLPCDVAFPFDGTGGIGDQMSVLDELTPQRSPVDWRRETAYRACVEIYSAGGGGPTNRYRWPYKLLHANNAKPASDIYAEKLIVDSDINNPDATNEDVLDAANAADADIVVPKDYLHDRERTTESVKEFLDLYESHPCSADYLIPLQPPHDEHAKNFPDEDGFLVGGIKDEDPVAQLQHIRALRDEVGPDAYIHGLGLGSSREIIDECRRNPGLLNSMDCKTPEFAASRHRTPDKSMKAQSGDFVIPGGDGTSTGVAIAAELILWQIAHMLNPDWTPNDGAESSMQTGVGDFA